MPEYAAQASLGQRSHCLMRDNRRQGVRDDDPARRDTLDLAPNKLLDRVRLTSSQRFCLHMCFSPSRAERGSGFSPPDRGELGPRLRMCEALQWAKQKENG